MPPRRSHHKSRNGCLTCKKRRVKCDETGPPCQNCRARGTECDYAGHVAAQRHDSPASDGKDRAESRAIVTHRMSAGERRIVELQLWHRWSTTTYRSCSTKISDDYVVWQKTIPGIALERGNEFLFETLLALTAFEMAYSVPLDSGWWLSVALEYQLSAFHGFRDSLQSGTGDVPDNHDALLYCSILLFVLALAMATRRQPFDGDSVIEHIVAVHELVRGASLMVTQKPEYVDTHPLWRKIPKLQDLVKVELDPATADVLRLLGEMNDLRRMPGEDQSPAYTGCSYAIISLRFLFQTCLDNDFRSYALAWLSMSGNDYIQAVKAGDPVALLSLVCWGVMLEPVEPEYWYLDGFGRRVVIEVSEMLGGKDMAPPGQDILQWAMGEIVYGRASRQSTHDSAVDGCESTLATVSLA